MNNKEMNNDSILVAWARKSKSGDKIVLNVSRQEMGNCFDNEGKVKIVCNLNRIVGLIEDKVEVVAVNHLVPVKFDRKELKIKFRGDE